MENVELGSSLSDITALGARFSVSLDFRNVETVTASTLSKLLNLRRNIRALGGRLTLRHVPPFAVEVLRVTRLDTVFEVQPQQDSKKPKRKRERSSRPVREPPITQRELPPDSWQLIARRFGISEDEVRKIEREGIENSWPPF